MPRIEDDIWQPYKDRGLLAWSLSSSVIGTEDPDNLAGYVEGLGLTMPILLDASTTVYDDYRIESEEGFAPYPREYIIGRDGTLLYLAADIDVPAMQAILDAELPPAR